MNWLFEHIQLVIVLAVVGVTLVGKVLEAIRGSKPAPDTTLEEMLGPEEDAEPVTGRPTAEVPRRAASPPPLRQVTLPVDLGAMATEMERQQAMQERLRKIRAAKAPAATAAAAAVVEAPMVVKRPTISSGLKGQLRSSKELRRAVILREILGPPVGLR
jgi:hypothetical protein